MSEWQPIETAPKDGTEILVYGKWAGEIHGPSNNEPGMEVGFWADGTSDYPGSNWWALTGGDAYATWIDATHWMPLPQPPNP